ncbi:MAG: cytochrome c3 family protein [Dehalococcoidia bacterium]|nr:cytochrome c3 family protein [Dehalococcoidia bacterium]
MAREAKLIVSRKLIPLSASVAAAALALVMVAIAQAGKSDVYGSAHDLGSPGVPACSLCHVPHNAQGAYLWARDPAAGQGLLSLCFSCHDGSVTDVGWFIPDPAYASHWTRPGIPGFDCDICHDPHEGDNWKFAGDNIPSTYRNADLCALCHDTGSFTHPVDVATGLPADRTWDPYAAPPDFSGTLLWDSSGTLPVAEGDAYVKCKTCHVAHGAVRNPGGQWEQTLNTMSLYELDAGPPERHLQPLCSNCHE